MGFNTSVSQCRQRLPLSLRPKRPNSRNVAFGLVIALSLSVQPVLAHSLDALVSDVAPVILPSGISPTDKEGGSTERADQSLDLEMSPGTGPGAVVLELVNRGDTTVYVLRDGTPFDEQAGSDLFRIVPSGKGGIIKAPAQYVGPVYRRMEPDASRYVALTPGASVRAEIDLSVDYEIPVGGAYRIAYTGNFNVIRDGVRLLRSAHPVKEDAWRPETETLEMTLAATPPQIELRALQPLYGSCDAGQRSMIEQATVSAEAFANESIQSLQSLAVEARPSSPRYTTWFGFYTAPNYQFVTTVFERISNVLANEQVFYRCNPDRCSSDSTVAYVQPFLREDINLCPLFFDQNIDDTFRAGTVVHELSHLLRLGNTDDLSYGSAATAALASNSPIDALKNADSYTLFATNDRPTLPMVDDGSGNGPMTPNGVDNPGTGINFSALAAGSAASNELAADMVNAFQVTGAVALELSSLSGDADLYVFDDPVLSEASLVCSSTEPEGSEDRCAIVGDGDRFVLVHAFTAASYRLDAIAGSTDAPPEDVGAITLVQGQSVSGQLAETQASLYTGVMPGRIILTTRSGDADLYVFRDATYTEEARICSSLLTTAQDVCELPGTGTVYIAVYGYAESSTYDVELRRLDGAPSDDDPIGPVSDVGGSGGGAGAPGFLTWSILLLGSMLRLGLSRSLRFKAIVTG